MKEPSEPETPGGAPPRERVKMKKVITSIIIVEVEVVATVREVVDFVGVVVVRAVVERAGVVTSLTAKEDDEEEDTDTTEVETKAVELAIFTAREEATDVAVTDDATELLNAVVLLLKVIVQLVAAPLPSSWHTTGWKGIADGGQVSCVNDMRYLSQRKVNRLFPTHASGVVVPVKMVSKPFRNAGATETISWQ
jgi:hypothetical protein